MFKNLCAKKYIIKDITELGAFIYEEIQPSQVAI